MFHGTLYSSLLLSSKSLSKHLINILWFQCVKTYKRANFEVCTLEFLTFCYQLGVVPVVFFNSQFNNDLQHFYNSERQRLLSKFRTTGKLQDDARCLKSQVLTPRDSWIVTFNCTLVRICHSKKIMGIVKRVLCLDVYFSSV